MLILDDYGTHSSKPWAEEKLFQLINHRYNGRLPTVITSNLAVDQIDERLGSRMVDQRVSICFGIQAPAYRIGLLYASRQQYGPAARAFREELHRNPDDRAATMEYALALSELGDVRLRRLGHPFDILCPACEPLLDL